MFIRALILVLVACAQAGASGVVKVTATTTDLLLALDTPVGGLSLVELAPYETNASAGAVLATQLTTASPVRVPRFDGPRDRLYSGFVATRAGEKGPETVGAVRFAENLADLSRNRDPHPKPASKKGLQVQMVDDALALGIQHSTLNFNLAGLIQLQPQPDSLKWEMDGQTYYFSRRYLDSQPVKPLTDAGVVVNFILLHYLGRAEVDAFMKHPRCDPATPNKLTAFNTVTPDGLRHFKAVIEFLADRYSGTNTVNGRVSGYIVGNEVNAHWEWYNLGPATRAEVAADYLRTVRVTHTAVRKASAHARVYLSLTHYWDKVMRSGPLRSCEGKGLLDDFNSLAKAGGDFDWHLAHHPYPENLFEPRTWLDKQPTAREDTPKITFKNIEVLDAYFRRPELLHRGQPRRIILSEQGFNCPDKPDGELWQAAAYCYAWKKVESIAGIDAFILHRHVDHGHEGGLNLGLWTRQPDSVATPGKPRKIHEAFKAAGTPDEARAFEFALPVIGLKDWSQSAR
ncbi:MAG: hypothetical protein CK546_08420 [Pedosphaera sp.]|nr:MAG: hypothetical protein CK546_08420 [Pedosphaera sp.]